MRTPTPILDNLKPEPPQPSQHTPLPAPAPTKHVHRLPQVPTPTHAIAHVDEPLERDHRAHEPAHQLALRRRRPAVRREVEQQSRSPPSLPLAVPCAGGAGRADHDPPAPNPTATRTPGTGRGEVDGERIQPPCERELGGRREVRERVERPPAHHPYRRVLRKDDVCQDAPHVEQRPADAERAPPQLRQLYLLQGGGLGPGGYIEVDVGEDEGLEGGGAEGEEAEERGEGDGGAFGQEEVREVGERGAGDPAHVSEEQAAEARRAPFFVRVLHPIPVRGRRGGGKGRGRGREERTGRVQVEQRPPVVERVALGREREGLQVRQGVGQRT